MKCPDCKGSGGEYLGPFFSGPCIRCNGTGEIVGKDDPPLPPPPPPPLPLPPKARGPAKAKPKKKGGKR